MLSHGNLAAFCNWYCRYYRVGEDSVVSARRFADGLNGWAQKVYDMFTFPGVLDKVKKLGEDLANALNGLVDAS